MKFDLITELVTQLGGEVILEKKAKSKKGTKAKREEKHVSPTIMDSIGAVV